ncbi:hypothetical protein HAX54_042047, partial [Datura stramonium]|nr:hypothetical protein [Datura stramonium]
SKLAKCRWDCLHRLITGASQVGTGYSPVLHRLAPVLCRLAFAITDASREVLKWGIWESGRVRMKGLWGFKKDLTGFFFKAMGRSIKILNEMRTSTYDEPATIGEYRHFASSSVGDFHLRLVHCLKIAVDRRFMGCYLHYAGWLQFIFQLPVLLSGIFA